MKTGEQVFSIHDLEFLPGNLPALEGNRLVRGDSETHIRDANTAAKQNATKVMIQKMVSFQPFSTIIGLPLAST